MRKIMSKAQERKIQKRNQSIVAIIMVFLLLFSVLGLVINNFGTSDNSNSFREEEYNGFEFIQNNSIWYLELPQTSIPFSYFPDETDGVRISGNLNTIEDYASNPLYIYSEDYPSTSEVYNSLGLYTSRVQTACESEENCPSSDDPIKDCSENFILIKESENSSITQMDNCTYIEGQKENLLKITDEFLFKVMGIKD